MSVIIESFADDMEVLMINNTTCAIICNSEFCFHIFCKHDFYRITGNENITCHIAESYVCESVGFGVPLHIIFLNNLHLEVLYVLKL